MDQHHDRSAGGGKDAAGAEDDDGTWGTARGLLVWNPSSHLSEAGQEPVGWIFLRTQLSSPALTGHMEQADRRAFRFIPAANGLRRRQQLNRTPFLLEEGLSFR